MTRITVVYSVGCDVTIGHHYTGTGYQSSGELSAGLSGECSHGTSMELAFRNTAANGKNLCLNCSGN